MAATSPALNAKGALQSNAFEEVEEEVDKSFIIQREIELLKKAGEKFGIRLANVSRRYIVVSVCEGGHGEDAATHLCPAMRSSLEFGDEIVTVNGIQVSSALTSEQTAELLDNATTVRLTVRARPFITNKTLRRHYDGPMGLKILNGIVIEVAKDGPAERAGVRPNKGVIAINGRFAMCMSDVDIAEQLRSSWSLKHDTVTISLVGAKKYKIIRDAVLKLPEKERPTTISSTDDHIVSPIPKTRSRALSSPTMLQRAIPLSLRRISSTSPIPSPTNNRSPMASPVQSAPISIQTEEAQPVRTNLAQLTINEPNNTLLLPSPPRAARSQSVPYGSQFELIRPQSPIQLLDPITAAYRSSSPSAIPHSPGCRRRASSVSNSRSNSPNNRQSNNSPNGSPISSPVFPSPRHHCTKCDMDKHENTTNHHHEERRVSRDLSTPQTNEGRTKSLTHEDLVQLGYTFHASSSPVSPGMVYTSVPRSPLPNTDTSSDC